MKKTGKLAVLLLVVAMLCTVFAVTSSADYTTKVLLNKDCSSGATDSGKVNLNPADDNYYLSYRYVASPDVYDFGVTQSNAFNGDWAYMTLDYDLMTETTYESGNGTSLYVMTRDGGGSPLGIRMIRVASNSDGTAKIVGAISGESYEIPGEDFSWIHITNVLMFKHDRTSASEVTNDQSVLLTYVNGKLALTQTGVVTERSLNINGFRLQSATKTVSDATVCVDNVKLVLLGKGYDGNLTKLFDGGDHSLTDEDFDVAFTKDYKIPFGKKRAGVFNLAGYETLYDKTQAAFDAAKDGYEIKLYDDVSNVEITNAITVDTNGHDFSWIPGDLAVTKTERNGSTVYTFKKTDRYAYFTFYPEGADGEADGVDIPVPIGATPVYTGNKLKLTYEDADGRYFVFKEWRVFGETPVTPVTAADVDSYFELYPYYEERKAPTTGKIVYTNDCEKGGLNLSNGASATFGSSGLVKAAGNNYYRYFAVLDAAGNSNPGGTSAFIMLPFGATQFTDLSYYTIEFDISTEDIAAAGNFQHTGRNSANSPGGSTPLNIKNENGKMVLTMGGGSVTVDPGEWVHVTIVVQSTTANSGGTSGIFFVNGERIATIDSFWRTDASRVKIDDFRFVPATNNPAGATLCFDNVTLQTFGKSYTGSLSSLFTDSTADLNKRMYRDVMWSDEYVLPTASAAARVDGVDYDTMEEALAALPEGGTLELLRDLAMTLTIDREMTVITNGYAFKYTTSGYDVTVTDGVYVFKKTTRIAYYTFYNIDGSVLIADVPVIVGSVPAPGVDFATAYEREDGALLVFSAWYRDGRLLGAVTESDIGGHFDVYPNCTILSDYSALLYDKDGKLSVIRSESGIAAALAGAEQGSTFIFNCDYYVSATIKLNGIYLDLNGHTITSNGNASVNKYSPFSITKETYIYSSKKGGYIRICPVVINGVEQNYAAADPNNKVGTPSVFDITAPLNLGTVYNPVLKKTADGDNLTVSGGALINIFGNRFTIDGGHYFSVLGDFAAPFNSRSSIKDHSIRNAEIYTNRILFAFQGANNTEITIDNCKIYFASNVNLVAQVAGASGANPSGTLYLTNTQIFGGKVDVQGGTGRIVIGENCVLPNLGTTNTSLSSGLILASRTTRFVPSEELTNFVGKELSATSGYYTTLGTDLVTVVWQDGTIDKWLVGTLPTHTTAGGQLVVDGWLCTTDGTWTFEDADGNVLTFETLPMELKGKTIYAKANLTKVKEVYATISYGSTVEYFETNSISAISSRLMALGQVASNGAITVTFHRDIITPDVVGLFTGSKDNVVPFYIDLNGHRVEIKGDFLSVKGQTNYFIYSSQPGAMIKTTGNLAYNFSRNNSVVNIGTVTTADGVTHSGDNLTVYAGRLYNNGTYGTASYSYTYRLNGGTYHLTGSLFLMDAYASVNVTLENATFYSASGAISIQNGRTATFTASGCTFYFAEDASFIMGAGTGTITLMDSAVYGIAVGQAGKYKLNLSGNISLSHMPLSDITVTGGYCLAHTTPTTVTFTDADGVTHTYAAAYRMAKLSDVVTVEWKSGDTTKTDYWLPGTRLEFLLAMSPYLDPSDDNYAFVPNGNWRFVLNGGILTDTLVEDWMAGGTVTATPQVERVKVAFYIVRADGTLDVYTATDYNTFRNALQSATSGSRVVMHTDYENIENARITLQSGTIEIDMNGHVISTPTKDGNGDIFNLSASNTLYIYSSKPGARLYAYGGGFTVCCSGSSKLYIGLTKDGKTFDRENLLLQGNSVVQLWGNAVVTVKNITYLADVGDNSGLFQFQGNDAALSIDNCRIVVTIYTSLIGGRAGNGGTVTISNSEIYIYIGNVNVYGFTGGHKDFTGKISVNVTTTSIYCRAGGWQANAKAPVTLGEGCRVVATSAIPNVTLADGMAYARISPVTMAIPVFSKTYGGELPYEVCAEGNTAKVGWVESNGTTTTEVWKKGEIPTKDDQIETADKYIYYVYRVDAPLTEDIIVNPTLAFLLPMKENLTLTANFTYNLYIPKDAADVVKRVVLNGQEYTLSEIVTIDDVDYYVISYKGITPRDAMTDITATIYAENSDGESFEKTLTLSICDYAEKVLAGDPNAETEQMIVDMLAYIRAAYCYFTPAADRDTARVDALLEGRTPSAVTYGTAADLGNLKEVLSGASLGLDGTPAFIFRVKDSFQGKLTVSYTDDNGETVSYDFDFTKACDMYVICEMSMLDLRKTLTLTATDAEGNEIATGSYNLDAYILGVSGDLIPDFAERLYAYSVSCEAYAKAGN